MNRALVDQNQNLINDNDGIQVNNNGANNNYHAPENIHFQGNPPVNANNNNGNQQQQQQQQQQHYLGDLPYSTPLFPNQLGTNVASNVRNIVFSNDGNNSPARDNPTRVGGSTGDDDDDIDVSEYRQNNTNINTNNNSNNRNNINNYNNNYYNNLNYNNMNDDDDDDDEDDEDDDLETNPYPYPNPRPNNHDRANSRNIEFRNTRQPSRNIRQNNHNNYNNFNNLHHRHQSAQRNTYAPPPVSIPYNNSSMTGQVLIHVTWRDEGFDFILSARESVAHLKQQIFETTGVTASAQELVGWASDYVSDETLLGHAVEDQAASLFLIDNSGESGESGESRSSDSASVNINSNSSNNSSNSSNNGKGNKPNDEVADEQVTLFYVNFEGTVHELQLIGFQTFGEIKNALEAITNVPTKHIKLEGWPDSLIFTDKTTLGSVRLHEFSPLTLTMKNDTSLYMDAQDEQDVHDDHDNLTDEDNEDDDNDSDSRASTPNHRNTHYKNKSTSTSNFNNNNNNNNNNNQDEDDDDEDDEDQEFHDFLDDDDDNGFSAFSTFSTSSASPFHHQAASSSSSSSSAAAATGAELDVDQLTKTSNFEMKFQGAYGTNPYCPPFYIGSFGDALKDARGASKLLFVYLHSNESQHTDTFCNEVLCNPTIANILADNFVVWGWDNTSSEDKMHFFRIVSQYGDISSIQITDYPFCIIFARVNSSLHTIETMSGFISADDMQIRLLSCIEKSSNILLNEKLVLSAIDSERQAREDIKNQQDREYQESLARDAEKEKQRLKLEQEQIELENAENAKFELEKRELENIQNQVLPEPDTSVTEPVCTVRFRGPQNFTAQRRFLMSSPLKAVQTFVAAQGFPPANYKMISFKTNLSEMDQSLRLDEVPLKSQELIHVQEK